MIAAYPQINKELSLDSCPNVTYFHRRLTNPVIIQTSVCSKNPETTVSEMISAAIILANGIHDANTFSRGNLGSERMSTTVNVFYKGVVFAVSAGMDEDSALGSFHYAKESIKLSQEHHDVYAQTPYLIREFPEGPKGKSQAFMYRIK